MSKYLLLISILFTFNFVAKAALADEDFPDPTVIEQKTVGDFAQENKKNCTLQSSIQGYDCVGIDCSNQNGQGENPGTGKKEH